MAALLDQATEKQSDRLKAPQPVAQLEDNYAVNLLFCVSDSAVGSLLSDVGRRPVAN